MTLEELGWDLELERSLEGFAAPDCVPARVLRVDRGMWRVQSLRGEENSVLSAAMLAKRLPASQLPVVGDWVVLSTSCVADSEIVGIVPRRTKLSRKAAGEATEEQVLVANVDHALLVTSLDRDFNLRRIERMLTLVKQESVRVSLLLNKSDLARNGAARAEELARWVPGDTVLPISAHTGEGLERVRELLEPRRTHVLLGSSGVGKSTLVNRLIGEERMRTFEVRAKDSRGRHTTTFRQLVRLPNGALLIDTPGMREFQFWSAEQGLSETFADIEELARGCRFSNCTHQNEPGCSVKAALLRAELDAGRYASFSKLQTELRSIARRRTQQERRQRRRGSNKPAGKSKRRPE